MDTMCMQFAASIEQNMKIPNNVYNILVHRISVTHYRGCHEAICKRIYDVIFLQQQVPTNQSLLSRRAVSSCGYTVGFVGSSVTMNQPTENASRDGDDAPLSAECIRCASFLTSALLGDRGRKEKSKIRSLLEAMGATAHLASAEEKAADDPGSSVIISIPSSDRRALRSPFLSTSLRRGIPAQHETLEVDLIAPVESATESRRRERLVARGPPSASLPTLATSAATAPIAGGGDDDSNNSFSVSVSCRPCSSTGPESRARAYVRGPDPLSVVLCSDQLRTPEEVSEVLVHEFVHVYDLRVRGLDLRDCRQLAHSEVRAAREAECGHLLGGGYSNDGSLRGGGWLDNFTRNVCIKSRAGVATCNMFPDTGRSCVADVFERAVKDTSPFDCSPQGGNKEKEGRSRGEAKANLSERSNENINSSVSSSR